MVAVGPINYPVGWSNLALALATFEIGHVTVANESAATFSFSYNYRDLKKIKEDC